VVDVQIKRLALEQRWGAVISRDRALLRAFAFARLLRETFRTWPARVGPLIAAEYNVDATALDAHPRDVSLRATRRARERPEF